MESNDRTIEKIGGLFRQMVSNADKPGEMWKNISLGKEAFSLMRTLPDVVPGEFETPEIKAGLLGQMLGLMEVCLTPRFCMEVLEYMCDLDPGNEDYPASLARLRDYVDLSFPMEEYCRKYRKMLKFDPVERTPEMEAVVEEVEREVCAGLAGTPRGMGFCFAYWNARRDALARRGIEWRSPHLMNPRVIFD